MLITQPALTCLEVTLQRLIGRSGDEWVAPALPADSNTIAVGPGIDEAALATNPVVTGTARPAPAVAIGAPPAPNAPLTPNELRARAAALRAMALGRERHFAAAKVAFTEAARLDPLLDLTRTPAFWKLERAAHEAAIAAYVETGRERDAALLQARIRSTFRPKALRTERAATVTT